MKRVGIIRVYLYQLCSGTLYTRSPYPCIILPTAPRLAKRFITSHFWTKTVHHFLTYTKLAKCPAHFILIEYITLIILGENHKLFNFILSSHYFVTSSSEQILPNLGSSRSYERSWTSRKIQCLLSACSRTIQ